MNLSRRRTKFLHLACFSFALIVSGFLFPSLSHAASADYSTSADFFVDNSGHYPNGDNLYNAQSGNWVGNAADSTYGEAQAAVKFDLTSLPGSIAVSDARLTIYVNDVLGNPDLYKLYGSNTDSWLETATAIPSKDILLNTYNGPITPNQTITVNVTSFVQNQMALDKIMSFVLTGNATGGDSSFNFNSKESAAHKPTLSVTYVTLSSNANLSGLALSSGVLTPAFSSATTTYSAYVPDTVDSILVTPTVTDNTATVQINSVPAVSGSSSSVDLNTGPNTIPVTVTAQDGTVKTYTVTVTRDPVPVTTLSIAGSQTNGWYTSDALVTLAASGYPNVVQTEFRINGGPWVVYSSPISLHDNGTVTLDYRSLDRSGNLEAFQSAVIRIDQTAPTTQYHFDPIYDHTSSGNPYIKGFTVTLRASDNASGSGVGATSYRINGGAWTPYTDPFVILAGTTHTVEYFTTDIAGNAENSINKMDFDNGTFTGAGSF